MSIHGATYIYAGAGTWPVSVDQTEEMLETVLDSRGIKQVDSLECIDKATRLVVIPGGQFTQIALNIDKTAQKIIDFVANGGKFLGICAGAILATKGMLGKPPIIDTEENLGVTSLQKRGKIFKEESSSITFPGFLSLYPGQCVAPHIVREPFRADHLNNFCAVGVNSFIENERNSFSACHYSGPAFFSLPEQTNVLLRYEDPIDVQAVKSTYDRFKGSSDYQLTEKKIYEVHPPAAISYRFGNGKIVLTGIHLEINPKSFATIAQKHSFLGKLPVELEASETHRKKFLDKVFTELDLN